MPRHMPQVLVGAQRFEDLYPQPVWDRLLDHMERAISDEITASRTPRKYLGDTSRFLPFFKEEIRKNPELGIRDEQVEDIFLHVHDEFFGLGLIRLWLNDPEVEDIIMDSWRRVDVSKKGIKHSFTSPFVDDEDAALWMQRLLEKRNKILSPNNPMENGQLADGSRIICTIPPVTPTAGFSMRKHRADRFHADAYRASGVAPMEFFGELETWVRTKQNLLISGATGSGKTTFINYAGHLIDPDDRVLVVEDTRELQIPHPRVYQLTAVSRGARVGRHDEKDITIRDLVAATLRMKPDRIIVGEVRGPEAFDMLNAMNTGHDGGMTTLHSNSGSEAILRLESLAAPALENMPVWALQDLIGVTVGIVIQMKQLPKSSRRVVVEASQILHPDQVLDKAVLTDGKSRDLRDGRVFIRPLWKWNHPLGQLEKVADLAQMDGHGFNG